MITFTDLTLFISFKRYCKTSIYNALSAILSINLININPKTHFFMHNRAKIVVF